MTTAPLLLATIFLNGVNIDGLRGQTFERCKTVKIDERGDVHLDCPGYQVETQKPAAPAVPASARTAPAAPAAPAAAITKRYWLVTEQTEQGAAQYDMDVFINSKWLRKFKSGESQVVLEITKFMNPGPNKLIFAATKQIEGGQRKSASPTAYLKAMVGEGEAGGNNVMIDNLLLEVKRTAAEVENINQEFTVNAR